ncbi:MAG: hypothetical protein H0U90_05190 [Actinobacteria bacterium]|nr:hypothetical protein [Actinomycetota bacterium]
MNDDTRPRRDAELGAALRALEVPEHAPDFDARLRGRLERERPVPERSNVISFPRLRFPTLTIATVAAAAVAAVIFFGIQGADVRQVGSEPATAARITARMAQALASASSLTGTLTIRNREGELGGVHTMRWTFALDAEGNFKIVEEGAPGALIFLAAQGREVSYGAEPVYGDRRGLAPGPPDQGPSESILQRDLGSIVRALASTRDVRVTEVTYRGRPAWVLRAQRSLRLVIPEDPTDRIAVTVDKETAFPVRIVETLRGRFVSEIRIDRLRVDPELPVETFRPSPPRGSRPDFSDVGFRSADQEAAERVVGYVPLAPAWLPEGFARAETAVARVTDPTAYGRNPVSRSVVSTAYRRGLSRVIVTTRLLGQDASAWSDPLALNENVTDKGQPFEFAGFAGFLVVRAGDVPHAWGLDDRFVVTVSGDLTRGELVRVARSLAPLDGP